MHGAGDMGDAVGGAFADLGEALGGIGELAGGRGDFGGAFAAIADQGFKAVPHAHEGVAEGVLSGAGTNFDGEVARGDGLGVGGHLAQVVNNFGEGAVEIADLIVGIRG
jgi:hypothetical protein